MHDECESNLNEDCSQNAHHIIDGLDWERTKQCVKESFSGAEPEDWNKAETVNVAIEKDLDYW
jgi:hypothetical protein